MYTKRKEEIDLFTLEKGEYGYIKKKKKIAILKMLIYIGIALFIFGVGLILNKMSTHNIFTVIAIVFVLPWARVMVEWIVLFPYQTPRREDYDSIERCLPSNAKLLSDVVITSTESSMGIDFLIMADGFVYGITSKENQDNAKVEKYLKDGIANYSDGYEVKLFDSVNVFIKRVESMREKLIEEEKREQVESYILSLIV